MAYRRGGFALTPPSILLFSISLIFAILSILIKYRVVSIPIINPAYVYELLLIGYIVLVVGVLLRRA
jgi:hypothetical protein